MKTIFAAIIFLAWGEMCLHAQGYIQLIGNVAGIDTNTATSIYDVSGVSGPAGGLSGSAPYYNYALLYDKNTPTAIDSNSAAGPDWSLVTQENGNPLVITNSTIPGSLWGNGGTGGIEVNLSSSTTYYVMLVGWSANLGSTWNGLDGVESQLADDAWSGDGFYGETVVGTITPFPTQPVGDPNLFPATWANDTMTLYAVSPEPATFALATVGGLSLLFLRRRVGRNI